MTTAVKITITTRSTDRGEVEIGDVIAANGTLFGVRSIRTWTGDRGDTVWAFDTEAVSEPSDYFRPFVRNIGDQWTVQGNDLAGQVEVVTASRRSG